MQLVLQLTRSCNLACAYCYQSHRDGPAMSAGTASRAVRYLLDQGHSHVALTYFGGEPLLARETIEATLPEWQRLSAQRGALITAKICTNGALLDESFLDLARRHRLFVSLSVDGAPEVQDRGRPFRDGRGSSQAVEKALDLLRSSGTPFATYQVITPQNARRLGESTRWLFRAGSRVLVNTLDFSADWDGAALRDLERGYRDLARLYSRWSRDDEDFLLSPFDSKISTWTRPDFHREESCAAGVHQIAVDPEGYIYPCIEFLEDQGHRIGHVDEGLDHQAWKQLNLRHGGGRPDACGDCGIAARCSSNCACLNLRTSGRMRQVTELLCTHERLITLAADRIAARLWKKRVPSFLRRQYDPHHHALRAVESLIEEALKS